MTNEFARQEHASDRLRHSDDNFHSHRNALSRSAQEQVDELKGMTSQQRQQFYSHLSRRDAGTVLPEMNLVPPPDQANLPRHQMQTDTGLGTRSNPINNNCQTTTLKNIFNFFGQDDKSSEVNRWETDLLRAVHDDKGKRINLEHVRDAFGASSRVDAAIQRGTIDGLFRNTVSLEGSKEKGYVASPAVATLFLSEMGCSPEMVRLGAEAPMQRVLQALAAGKPVMIGDSNTHTLLQSALAVPGQPERPPVQGHVYMVYQRDGKYFTADPGYPQPVEVTASVLRHKLQDVNSEATIVNNAPDTSSFLHHPLVH